MIKKDDNLMFQLPSGVSANSYSPPMDTVRVIQVIETTILRRGEGKDQSDPVRIVTQYWTFDGRMITEVDPCKK